MDMKKADARIEALLPRWNAGDGQALSEILETAYQERWLPEAQIFVESTGFDLEPGDLVHRVFFDLQKLPEPNFPNARAFWAFVTKTAMRRVALGLLKSENAKKRGGDAQHIPLASFLSFMETGGARDA